MKSLIRAARQFWLPLLLLSVVAGVLGYFAGNYNLHWELGEERAAYRILSEDVDELMARNEQLLERRAEDERHLQVIRQAMEHLQEMLRKREGELQDARSSLELYRKIMKSDLKPELEIHSLKLAPGETDGHWHYRLVLYQKRHEEEVRGHYDFVFYGRLENKEVHHRLSKLVQGDVAQRFAFKYFEVLTGQFRLPSGLEVMSLEVVVSPEGKRVQPLRELSEWRKLATADSEA